jgi:nitroreductase
MSVRERIEERRAYRSLDPVEVDDGTVRELARCAGLSASCFNKQPWRFIFARGEALEQLKGALNKGNAWATRASMIVAVVSEVGLDCRVKGRDYYLFDTGMATAFLILRATELGLVAHPIAGYSESKAKEVLGVPDEMTVITLIIVGRHSDTINELLSEDQAKTEHARPERMPLEEFAFMDVYGGGE